MYSSRKIASIVSPIAFMVYFYLIIFQIPLFRVPCRIGVCKTPIDMTCSQMIASEIFPLFIVKSLLYPKAFADYLMKGKSFPSYAKLLESHNFNNAKNSPAFDLLRLEILAGSYLAVAGAIVGVVIKTGRMRLLGMLLILWGFVKESILRKPGYKIHSKTSYMYPAMYVAVLFAFLSIRRYVRRIIRCCCCKTRRTKVKRL